MLYATSIPPDNICRGVRFMKLLIMEFPITPYYFSLSVQNIILNTLFSSITSLCPSCGVRHYVSHPKNKRQDQIFLCFNLQAFGRQTGIKEILHRTTAGAPLSLSLSLSLSIYIYIHVYIYIYIYIYIKQRAESSVSEF
jgi:hypothetical protein